MLISGDRIIKGIERVLRQRRGPPRNLRERSEFTEGGTSANTT
jgi:hypothetical protein